MEFLDEIRQGETLIGQMTTQGEQLAQNWQDDCAHLFLNKYFDLCDRMRQTLKKLDAE